MTDKLTQAQVTTFLDDLASSKPAPGGGSVAGLTGALAAALLSMVGNLTIGKKKYEAVQEDITGMVGKSEKLRKDLTDLIEADIAAYTELNQTMKMPRETDEQKAARDKAMDTALKAATNVPMRIAEACAAVMNLCGPFAAKGNTNAISDVGVAVLLAEAGLRSAALNVLINLGYLKDDAFIKQAHEELDGLLENKPKLRDDIYEYVVNKL